MNSRIKEIRKNIGLSQELFGKKIGISRDTVANIEAGRIEIKDIFINSICREFSINEHWLRTGEGEMRMALTRNQEIADFADELMAEVDESFKKRLIIALSKLKESDWEVIQKISEELK